MEGTIYLRTFTADELVLDENETRLTLKSFFPSQSSAIETMPINDNVRGLAQGLLVAAIDASYTMGYVQSSSIVSAALLAMSPSWSLVKSFGKKAAKHWFKHAKSVGSMDAKIYHVVRAQISLTFINELFPMLSSAPRNAVPPMIAWRASSAARGNA